MDFLNWLQRDCSTAEIGDETQSLCPEFSDALLEHFVTPEDVETPIEINNIEDMRLAMESALVWMESANLYTAPAYNEKDYVRWTACRIETQLINDDYNSIMQNASRNDTGFKSKFAQDVLDWQNAFYGGVSSG